MYYSKLINSITNNPNILKHFPANVLKLYYISDESICFLCHQFGFTFISGNSEIGNGYGVPGGGAYYDALKLNTTAGIVPLIPKLFVSCCITLLTLQ